MPKYKNSNRRERRRLSHKVKTVLASIGNGVCYSNKQKLLQLIQAELSDDNIATNQFSKNEMTVCSPGNSNEKSSEPITSVDDFVQSDIEPLGCNDIINESDDSCSISSNSSHNDRYYNNLSDSSDYIDLNLENEDKADRLLTLREKLAAWVIECNVPQTTVRKILEILKDEQELNSFSRLPLDPRTLLKTPRKTQVKIIAPGTLYYFGISHCINSLLDQYDYHAIEGASFDICVNVDGLPISKSSGSCLWPILFRVDSIPSIKKEIMMAGVYHGLNKPGNFNDFLRDFVDEAVHLTNSGIIINEKTYNFRVRMLICDAPAKSAVLNIVEHNSYSACPKCTEVGIMANHVMCFPQTIVNKRTNIQFRQQLDPDHHKGVTEWTNLPDFDCVDDVVQDPLHVLHHRAVKKILAHEKYGLVCGKPPHKLRYRDLTTASRHLESLAMYMPCEFNRRPRTLLECRRYKATEMRAFILYTGCVIFKSVLQKKYYIHLLMLMVASRIMSSEELCTNPDFLNYADSLMKEYIKTAQRIYGCSFVSHKVHALQHLADDVRRSGPLDSFSAYDFENYLQRLKNMLRKAEKPLQQIINRVTEGTFFKKKIPETVDIKLSQPHMHGPLIPGCISPQYKMLKTSKFTLKLNTKGDSYVQLKCNEIISIKNIATSGTETVIIGNKFRYVEDFFSLPCESSIIGIYMINIHDQGPLQHWKIAEIKYKLVYLPLNDISAVVLRLLHI